MGPSKKPPTIEKEKDENPKQAVSSRSSRERRGKRTDPKEAPVKEDDKRAKDEEVLKQKQDIAAGEAGWTRVKVQAGANGARESVEIYMTGWKYAQVQEMFHIPQNNVIPLTQIPEVKRDQPVATDVQIQALRTALNDGLRAIPPPPPSSLSSPPAAAPAAAVPAAASSPASSPPVQEPKKIIIHCSKGLNRTPVVTYMHMVENLGVEPNAAEKMINNALADRAEAARVREGKYHLDMYGRYKIKERCHGPEALPLPPAIASTAAAPAPAPITAPPAQTEKAPIAKVSAANVQPMPPPEAVSATPLKKPSTVPPSAPQPKKL